MEEKEYSNVYAIPANFTNSGKILGGMLEPRNAVETVFLLLLLGYPELMLIPMSGTIRVVVMTVTLLPVAVIAMMGIDGDSLFRYLGHIVRYAAERRKLHYRRVGYHYEPKQLGRKKKSGKNKEGQGGKRKKKQEGTEET